MAPSSFSWWDLRDAVRKLGDESPERQTEVVLPILVQLTRSVGVWMLSHHAMWVNRAPDAPSRIILLRMPLVAEHLRSTTSLAESMSSAPSALTTARACFETGVKTGWMCDAFSSSPDPVGRILAVERESVRWMRVVAKEFDDLGERWAAAAVVREHRMTTLDQGRTDQEPLRVPSMLGQLEDLKLGNKYLFYRLASEVLHGGGVSGGDYALGTSDEPYGVWDWIAAFEMCVVGARCSMLYSVLADAENDQPDMGPFEQFVTFADEVLAALTA